MQKGAGARSAKRQVLKQNQDRSVVRSAPVLGYLKLEQLLERPGRPTQRQVRAWSARIYKQE